MTRAPSGEVISDPAQGQRGTKTPGCPPPQRTIIWAVICGGREKCSIWPHPGFMVLHTESQVRWNVPPGRQECSDAADTQRVVKYNWHFLLTLDKVERITISIKATPGVQASD